MSWWSDNEIFDEHDPPYCNGCNLLSCEGCVYEQDEKKMNDKVCKNCDYFEPYSKHIAERCGFIGLCHRYPDYRNVADGHWCGEWKDKNDD